MSAVLMFQKKPADFVSTGKSLVNFYKKFVYKISFLFFFVSRNPPFVWRYSTVYAQNSAAKGYKSVTCRSYEAKNLIIFVCNDYSKQLKSRKAARC